MHRVERKCDKTGDILVGLYNFSKTFLAKDEELTVSSALNMQLHNFALLNKRAL